jgi:hypothetical protein
MIQARAWPVRVMYILIAAALAIGLFITAAPAHKVSASPDAVKAEWDIVDTPTMNGFVLAPESTIYDLAYASGGDVAYAVVYAYDETWYNQEYRLLKSTDGAATWTDLTDTLETQVEDDGWGSIYELLRVETDNVDPDFLAVAVVVNSGSIYTPVHVYISNDGGDTFVDTGEVEAGGVYLSLSGFTYGVTDLAVSPEVDGKRDIAAAGTANTAGGAGIFRCTVTGDSPGAWKDATAFDGWDDDLPYASWVVTFMEFSPNYALDRTILVTTVCDGTDYDYAVYLQCGSWGTTTPGWNDDSTLGILAVPIIDNVPMPTDLVSLDARGLAGLTLPSDYNSKSTDTRVLWVWVNYWDPANAYAPASVIMRVDNDAADKVGRQVKTGTLWLTNVSYYGTIAEGKAIAGILGTGGVTLGYYGSYAYEYSLSGLFTDCVPVQVYRNTGITNMDICCTNWQKACKPPTGETAMAVEYVSVDKAYAVALDGFANYDEGAWSVSFDDGNTWNQLSLIDTDIDYFSDTAVSPDCNKMWVVSINDGSGCGLDSVWLKATDLPEAEEYSGYWLRVWNGWLYGKGWDTDAEAGFIRLPADETTGDTVFLVDYGTENVYMNDLEGLGCWTSISSTTIDDIVDLAAPTADTLYALDGSGDVSIYDAEGWHKEVDSKVNDGWTIAVHGNNATDVLVGGAYDGDVSYSDDGGATFALLQDAHGHDVMTPIPGHVTVAFDTYFDTNSVIYAATEYWGGEEDNGGIYDWVLGTSTSWTDLGADHDYAYTGLVLSYLGGNPFTSAATGGVLYASYFYYRDETGVARSLTPLSGLECPTCEACDAKWDYLTESTPEDLFYGKVLLEATPFALKVCGCMTPDTNTKLFAVDVRRPYNMIDGTYAADVYYDNGRDFVDDAGGAVWTFEDCSAKKAPAAVSPADGASIGAALCECSNLPFFFKWDRLCDACSYDIEISQDPDFTEVVDYYCDFNVPEAAAPSFYYSESYLLPGVTYYWHVRAADAATDQVIHSWWSDAQSFTVAVGASAGVTLVSPAGGANNVGIKSVGFSWSIQATADAFDWVLSPNADLSAPLESKTGLTHTAYTCTKTLTHSTTYYWAVTAYNDGALVSTSSIGTFTTGAMGAFCSPQDGTCFETAAELQAYEAANYPHQAATPFWVWVVIAIGAVLVIVVIVLIFRTRRV